MSQFSLLFDVVKQELQFVMQVNPDALTIAVSPSAALVRICSTGFCFVSLFLQWSLGRHSVSVSASFHFLPSPVFCFNLWYLTLKLC